MSTPAPAAMSGDELNPREVARCALCGEPMQPGEEALQYHGLLGPCPKPPLPKPAKLATGEWVPVAERLPDVTDLEVVLMAGRQDNGEWWRDVGMYVGNGAFVDKNYSVVHPTLYMLLPPFPAAANLEAEHNV